MHSYSSSANTTFWLPSKAIVRESTNSSRKAHKSIFKGAAPSSSSFKASLKFNPLKTNKMNVAMHYKSHNSSVPDPSSDGSILSHENNERSNQFLFPLNIGNFFSTLSANLMDRPLSPAVDPKVVLKENFAPVDELPPTNCPVIMGELPPCLNGVYIRNGPNPQHHPVGPHHFLEGDGMLHSLRLLEGNATFCSRFVKTYKYTIEKDAGVPMIPNIFSGLYGLVDVFRVLQALGKVVLGKINLMKGAGVANSSVVLFANKLLALVEFDLPYAINLTQDGDIKTIGRYNFDGELSKSMTSHPKIDPKTGEMFAFRILPIFPYLTFFRFDSGGSKQKDVPIYSLNRPTYFHDLAITKRFAIFSDAQLEMASFNLIACKGAPASFKANKVPRLGFLPHYATSDSKMKWFDVPGINNALHILNAWEDEEDDNVIIIIVANALFVEKFMYNREDVHFSLEKLRIDMRTGMVTRTVLSERSLEVGSINSSYTGKKNRYIYMAICKDIVPKMCGAVKIDLELEREVGSRIYGHGWYGGEVFFVAADSGNEEDDGYVVSYVHNEVNGESQFIVMDAKSPTLDIVAAVRLPGRVPYGIHGLFVSEKDLQMM